MSTENTTGGFGPKQIAMQTPQWAKWMFRFFMLLTTAAAFIIASDPGIPDAVKVRIGVYLKGADLVMLGVSKMFGIKPDQDSISDSNQSSSPGSQGTV